MFNTYFKDKITDTLLLPIRKEIAEYVPNNSKVIDIGSGTGSLLFLIADKIDMGVGIDINPLMIDFCRKKAKKQNICNLDFKLLDVNQIDIKEKYDITTSTLTIHSLDLKYQISILRRMASISNKLIIADIIEPESIFTKIYIGFDEILAGHYNHFKEYIKKSGMDSLIENADLFIEKHAKTQSKSIDIWVCRTYK